MTPFDRQWPVTSTWLRAYETGNNDVLFRCIILASAIALNSPLLPRVLVSWWTKAVNGVTDR